MLKPLLPPSPSPHLSLPFPSLVLPHLPFYIYSNPIPLSFSSLAFFSIILLATNVATSCTVILSPSFFSLPFFFPILFLHPCTIFPQSPHSCFLSPTSTVLPITLSANTVRTTTGPPPSPSLSSPPFHLPLSSASTPKLNFPSSRPLCPISFTILLPAPSASTATLRPPPFSSLPLFSLPVLSLPFLHSPPSLLLSPTLFSILFSVASANVTTLPPPSSPLSLSPLSLSSSSPFLFFYFLILKLLFSFLSSPSTFSARLSTLGQHYLWRHHRCCGKRLVVALAVKAGWW